MKKILSVLFILNFASVTMAMKLEYYGETSLSHSMKFRKTKVGGLSAIVYHKNKLWALSDDKGKEGDPRFYIFDLDIQKQQVQLHPEEVHFIKSVPALAPAEQVIIDPEGLVILPSGELLVSSENNNDKKPRVPPRLLKLNSTGKYSSDITLPEKFIPEALGRQGKGLHNNAGFEGLSRTSDGEWIFAATELPIFTDEPAVENSTKGSIIRILKFNKKNEVVAEYGYPLEAPTQLGGGVEVFRGVSEILVINENRILVMERGVRLHKTGWTQTVALYVADLTLAADVSKVKNLSETKLKLAAKEKVLDLETDMLAQRPGKALQNFEGLAWGPVLPNKKNSLLVIADNNFSKKEITELLVFSVEAE